MLITVSDPRDSAKLILPATIKYFFDPGNIYTCISRPDDQKRPRLIISRNYLTYFDNISHLTNEESDGMCFYAIDPDCQEH
jgi:hypothetical protein